MAGFTLVGSLSLSIRNPRGYEMDVGYYDGASARVGEMLMCKDVTAVSSFAAEAAPTLRMVSPATVLDTYSPP